MNKLPNYFPSISRLITENKLIGQAIKSWKIFVNHSRFKKSYAILTIFLVFLATIVLVILISVISLNLSENFNKYQNLYSKRQDLYGKINFWKSIVQKYPGFPDAYFNIAVLYYELNDFNNSRKYFAQTLLLNPNYENANKLEDKLRK